MRWPATVVGYVADVKVGGIETVNCHAHDPHDRDTHIDLAVSAGDANDEAKHVVVEVTPLPASHRLSSFPGATIASSVAKVTPAGGLRVCCGGQRAVSESRMGFEGHRR